MNILNLLPQIMAFLQGNSTLLIVGLVIYLVVTKRIDISSILNLFKVGGQTPDISQLIQLLVPLLLKAKADGDAEAESAILKVMGHCKDCKE